MAIASDNTELILRRLRLALDTAGLDLWTEKSHIYWIGEFLQTCPRYKFADIGPTEVGTFLKHTGESRPLNARTRNEIITALQFLFSKVLERNAEWLKSMQESLGNTADPGLNLQQVTEVLQRIPYRYQLLCALMFGSGLRADECVRLRIDDLDFDNHLIYVRNSIGQVTRAGVLPRCLEPVLKDRMSLRRQQHLKDIAEGFDGVYLEPELALQHPGSHRSWRWQYLFSTDLKNVQGKRFRGHENPDGLRSALQRAGREVSLPLPLTTQLLRRSGANHLLKRGVSPRLVSSMLGLNRLQTKFQQVQLQKITSPLDSIWPRIQG